MKCGYIAEVLEHDYGYDLYLYTFDSEGCPEFGTVAIPLKATDTLHGIATDRQFEQALTRVGKDSPRVMKRPRPAVLAMR